MKRITSFVLISLLLLFLDVPVWAGMAAPLPEEHELKTMLRLNGTVVERIQAASFFLLTLLLCALAVRFLWNALQRDFPKLPRLTFGKSLVGVVLWGLLFVLVLAMIGGAPN